VREKLDAWLRDGGTILIVPISAFAVAALLGIIPMWLEFGAFPRWAPRDRVGAPLLVAWVVIFLASESARRYLAKRATRRWEKQWRAAELERADDIAGVIDRLCAGLLPQARGAVTPDRIHAALLQGIVDVARVFAAVGADVRLHASLLIPVTRREGRRQVPYLQIIGSNRLLEGRGWAAFKVDAKGPAQDTFRDGRVRTVPDTAVESVRNLFSSGSYRSIVTLPVTLRCMQGKRLAVVSIDASLPGVFTDELARSGLEQAVSPYIKLIALSLTFPSEYLRTESP
jgi:hypothetical protein